MFTELILAVSMTAVSAVLGGLRGYQVECVVTMRGATCTIRKIPWDQLEDPDELVVRFD